MSDSWNVPVTGTQSRPAFLPLFVIGRNNLNPRVVIDARGVTVKIVLTTRMTFGQIKVAETHKGLRSTYVTLTTATWEYLVHFRDDSAHAEFLSRLAAGGVALGPNARATP